MDALNEPDPADDDLDEAKDLAITLNTQIHDRRFDVILAALAMVSATVLRSATADEPPQYLAAVFAGLVVNIHAGLDDQPQQLVPAATTVGEGADPLTPAQVQAAVALCPALGGLMGGLLAHYETKNVVNAWFSVLLNVLLDGGVEKAQRVLRETADALPATAARMTAMRDLDAGANVSEMGRA